MLKRIVKEAARAATSSGGESSDRRTDAVSKRAAASSSGEEETDSVRQRKRRDATSDDSDASDMTKKKPSAVTKKKGMSAKKKKKKNSTSSGDEGGDDRKGGTTSATTDTTPRDGISTNLFKKKLQTKLKRMWNASKMKRAPLLELTIIEAVYSAMHGKDKKHARTKLLEMFAHYDTQDTGSIDDARFIKCITKIGVYLRKTADYDALVHCFVKGASITSEDDDDTSAAENKKKKKTNKMVDYIAFVDFACNVRDSEKLSQIADKLNKIIDKYDDKHDQSTTEPFNIFVDLKKLDKKKRKWIPSEQFAAFLQEHERPVFKLAPKEVQALTERFEYEYEKDELGVDYEQFARWLQPMLHLDIKDLHKRVQDLVKKAHERGGWDLSEVFQAMDNDGDGEITGVELKEALVEMGLPLTDTQIRCLVDEYDTNGDGRIQSEEFIALFPFLKKNVKRSEEKKKTANEDGDESEDGNSDRKPNGKKKKNTRKNTFSWDIGKAFARKHSAKGNSSASSPKKTSFVKKKKHVSSSEESSEDPREKAKSKKKAVTSSDEEESDTDKRRKPTKRAISSAKNKKRDPSSDDSESEKSSSENQAVKRGGQDKKAKRGGARRDPSSTETDEERQTKQKKATKSKKASKSAAATTDDDAKESSTSATELSAKPRSSRSRKKKDVMSSPTKRRSDQQLSTISHHSRCSTRQSQSRPRSRQRVASTVPGKVRRPKKNRSRSRSRVDRHARSRRQPTRRAKANVRHEDDGTTSSAESDNDSESSGLDMSQLRQLKKETMRHEGNEDDYHFDDEDDGEADNIQTRSDGEYEKHLKRSLRRAFDFFDLDQSDTIEKKELNHVLRALGHEFTTEELDEEMARADLDQNGQLDFHEFVAFVKRQLVQKQFLLSKRREMEIRQAFQSLDNDKNGVLDEKEFEYLIYKVLGVELSVEEQDALLDFVDENGDGNINEDEFIAFMRVMEEFHKSQGGKDKQRQFVKGLDGTSKLALTAMKKLVRGAPIDLDRNLLMFFGVPTNFRPAISSFATCRALQANTLEHVLSFPSPQMIVALAQDPNQSGSDKKNGLIFGPATSMKSSEDAVDENALLQQAESWQSQAIASLKRATGVPKPFDTREEDVVKRCVHVCLFQEQEEMHGKSSQSRDTNKKKRAKQPKTGGGAVVGNVHEIPVYWHSGQEDVWEFSKKATKENKYKFLVRTNTINDHLYLLVEFIVHLRMAKREKTRKGKRRHRKNKSGSKRDGPASDVEDNADGDIEETREMVCCWCKIPIRTLLAKRAGVFRSQLKLWGGTAHAPVDIEQDEILQRRTGWRALTNVFTKPTPPAMGIKSLPIEMLTEDLQLSVRKMPSTVIAPFLSLPILAEYMTLMKTTLSSGASSSFGEFSAAHS